MAKPEDFLYKPYFEGGPKAMKAFIHQNLHYPPVALEKQISGVVKLRYSVNYLGQVSQVSVIHGIGYGCDEEAIRLVTLLKFKVRRPRKGKVLYHKRIQIHFQLPVARNTPTENHLEYSYSYSKNEPNTSQSIFYQIELPTSSTPNKKA